MKRRDFIALLSGATAAWPLRVRAQQPAMPVIGYLGIGSRDTEVPLAAFRQGLSEAGYVEGQNVTIDYRWAEGNPERFPALAAELVMLKVHVILTTGGTLAAIAAKRATATIPIVFTAVGDPVEEGLVANLARPGGNMTGATQLNMELGPKRLELMHQLLPKATAIALIVNPTNPVVAEVQSRDAQEAARALGLQLQILQASTEDEFDKAVANLPKRTAGLVIAAGDAFFLSATAKFAAITARRGVPAISNGREFAAAGGLLSYGGSVAESYHLAGIYTGRILTGEKAADLPVQRSSKVEMFINLKTAKELGVVVPQGLVIAADEVFE